MGPVWQRFCERWALGDIYGFKEKFPSAKDIITRPRPLAKISIDTGTTLTNQDWQAQDLHAAPIVIRFPETLPSESKLKFDLTHPSAEGAALVYAMEQGAKWTHITTLKDSITLQCTGLVGKKEVWLYVLLVNTRAVKPFTAETKVKLTITREDPPLLKYLRGSRSFASNYYGWGASCNGNVCGNLGGGNADPDELIPIRWNGNSFAVKGSFSGGGVTYDIDIAAVVSADGRTIETARFYKKKTAITGTVEIDELEVSNVPFYGSYPGPLDAENASYVFQVDGEQKVRQAVTKLRSRVISSAGKVQRDTWTIVFNQPDPWLRLTFWRK